MPVLSPCEDVKSLIERVAGIQIVGKPSRVHGELEYHSNCPWCPGSTDSFITRPETGWYTHSTRAKGCGRHGDMLDFLQDYAGMSMREAIEEIGLDPDELDFIVAERDEERALARVAPPCNEWQESAQAWIHAFTMRQTLRKNPFALEYVHARGLTDESIEKFDIQYIPLAASGSWLVDKEPEKWGLSPAECPEENTEEGVKHVVKLPEGILIPWYAEGHLWNLEVRRLTDAKPYAKYMCVQGGQDTILFNLDAIAPCKPIVLVESAFCAILSEQVAGDIAVFVATGGAKKAQEERFIKLLRQASCVLVAFDDDEPDSEGKRAGDEGAKYWTGHLSNAMRWMPRAHDINDMFREMSVEDIRKWVTRGLKSYELLVKAKSLPVPEVPVPAAAPAPQPIEQPAAIPPEQPQSRPTYSPTLEMAESLKKGCPHTVLTDTHKSIPCKGSPGVSGWCEVHTHSHDLLCLGAVLGYPAVTLNNWRSIGAGVANWEAYAKRAPKKWLSADMRVICSKFNYRESLQTA